MPFAYSFTQLARLVTHIRVSTRFYLVLGRQCDLLVDAETV